MTNENLAILAQSGDGGALVQLWEQTRRFIRQKAERRVARLNGTGGVTEEDLTQAGFIALLKAVDGFKDGAGANFLTYLSMCLKTAFSEAVGVRTVRQKRDPLRQYVSIEAPVDGEEDGDLTIGDIIPDPRAVAAFDSIAERDFAEKRSKALRDAVGTLEPMQQRVLEARYFKGLTIERTAEQLKMGKAAVKSTEQKALLILRHPSRSQELQKYYLS